MSAQVLLSLKKKMDLPHTKTMLFFLLFSTLHLYFWSENIIIHIYYMIQNKSTSQVVSDLQTPLCLGKFTKAIQHMKCLHQMILPNFTFLHTLRNSSAKITILFYKLSQTKLLLFFLFPKYFFFSVKR